MLDAVFSLGAADAAPDSSEIQPRGPMAHRDAYDDDAVSALSAAPPRRRPALRPLDLLVEHQRADGSWDLDAAFAAFVSRSLADLEDALRGAAGDAPLARRALATAIALAWLEMHAAAERVEWELLAKKATQWLSTSRTEPAAGQGWHSWLDVARRLL
jgi:hypothetical protein